MLVRSPSSEAMLAAILTSHLHVQGSPDPLMFEHGRGDDDGPSST